MDAGSMSEHKQYEFVVTGGSGFIGRSLVRHLAATASVLSVDVSSRDSQMGAIDALQHDISAPVPDVDGVTGATLIHTAAVMRAPDDSVIWRANVEGTRNVLEFARANAMKRVIFFSTGGVYGYSDAKHTEADALDPIGVYGYSKLLGEVLVKQYARLYGLPATVLRLYFPFGPHQNSGIIPRINLAILEGGNVLLNPGGRPVISPIHVDDIVGAVRAVLDTPDAFETYNLCGDVCLSFSEIVEMLESVRDQTVQRIPINEVNSDLCGDNSKLKRSTGWQPIVPLNRDTLRNTEF